jgi:hypothetical protein
MFNKAGWKEGDAHSVIDGLNQADWMSAHWGDLYFSPLRYDGSRRRGFVGKPGIIFADLDDGHTSEVGLPPSLVIQSSPGHYHGYWFLDEPVDPALWEPHARGWTQELGADPGGWDLTQVLRMPNSLNHKYDPPAQVLLVQKNLDAVYPLDAFPKAEVVIRGDESRPISDDAMTDSVFWRAVELGTMPLSAIYWVRATAEDIKALGKIDRSRVMWQVERSLFEAGFTADEVFHMMRGSGVNKWVGQDDKLWSEILKAEASAP